MHRFDTTCLQHRLHLGSTSAIKAPTTGNFDPLNSNFSPTWLQDGATWPQLGLIWDFGPSWGPSRFKMGDIAGPIRNPLKRLVSLLGPTWCETVAKGAKLRYVRTDLGFHVHHMTSIWKPSGSLLGRASAQLAPTWALVGPKIAQLGTKTQRDMLHSYHHFQQLLALMGGSCKAHIGPVLGPTSAPDALPAHWPVRRKLRPSWLQVAPVPPNLRPRTAKFDPSRLLVGPSRPASFLSLSYSLGAVLVAKRLEYISKSF